jgi:hypothetical protein
MYSINISRLLKSKGYLHVTAMAGRPAADKSSQKEPRIKKMGIRKRLPCSVNMPVMKLAVSVDALRYSCHRKLARVP